MLSKNQQKFVRQLEQKKFRQKEGLFVAEGPKVVGDLIAEGFQAVTVFATEEWQAPADVCVTPDELKRISFQQHPQQVLGVFRIPEIAPASIQKDQLYLALDGVQDPGNLGTIIRIADWFGISAIFCSENTADAWNPKVIQATMGCIARVPVYYTDLGKLLDSSPVPVYGTLLDGQNIYEQDLTSSGIIVMGNEGNGISPKIRECITNRLLIPDFHNGHTTDSLNVAIATAITCSEFRRRF